MRLVFCLMLLALLTQLATPARRRWRGSSKLSSLFKWSPRVRSSHHSQAVPKTQKSPSHSAQKEPKNQSGTKDIGEPHGHRKGQATPAKDGRQPSFLGGLAKNAANIAVESSVAGVVGVGINKAFAGGAGPAPPQSFHESPSQAGTVGHDSPQSGQNSNKPQSQSAPSGGQADPQPSADKDGAQSGQSRGDSSGGQADLQPSADEDGTQSGQSRGDSTAESISDAARRARIRQYVAKSAPSSACITAPLAKVAPTVVLTLVLLVLRQGAVW